MAPLDLSNLDVKGRVAIVTGATRGIGKACIMALAKQGCHVVVTGKSVTEKPNLPGTIYSVAKEAEALGVQALPYRIDVRDENTLIGCVKETMRKFGRIDILVNNASALWWNTIEGTPMRKYDLIHSVNARGTFSMTKHCLPHMKKGGFGRVITMSPPIDPRDAGSFTAYYISKWGMTLTALGVAKEYSGKNVTGNSLWPATVIESYASINFKLGDRKGWRKADILADCVLGIVADGNSTNGQMLIDEDYLVAKGLGPRDLDAYSCVPGSKLTSIRTHQGGDGKQASTQFRRGNVRKVDSDKHKDGNIYSRL